MITEIKNWLSGLQAWVVAAIGVAACCIGVLLGCLWFIAVLSSGWVLVITILGVAWYIFYDVIRAGRKAVR